MPWCQAKFSNGNAPPTTVFVECEPDGTFITGDDGRVDYRYKKSPHKSGMRAYPKNVKTISGRPITAEPGLDQPPLDQQPSSPPVEKPSPPPPRAKDPSPPPRRERDPNAPRLIAPENHKDTDAVAAWVLQTVEVQEAKKLQSIIIPVTMMRTLLEAVDDLRREFE